MRGKDASDPVHAAKMWAGRDRYNAEMKEIVRLGLLTGLPGRLTPGETRITRAQKEIARMREEDAFLDELRGAGDLEALGTENNAEQWSRIHGQALDLYEDILGKRYSLDDEGAIPKLKLQVDVANTVNRISARLAVERFRGQRIGALARLLDRVREGEMIEVVEGEDPSTDSGQRPKAYLVGFEE